MEATDFGYELRQLRARLPHPTFAGVSCGFDPGEIPVDQHLLHLAESISCGSPALFTEFLIWARSVAQANGVSTEGIADLEELSALLAEQFSPRVVQEAKSFIERSLADFSARTADPQSYLNPTAPFGSVAQAYLAALLTFNRQEASDLIITELESGAQLADLYLHVFEPTLREVGRLWQIRRATVAMEHYCTAATQMIMSQHYPKIFTSPRNGRRMIAACVGGETHEVGVRMVADLFELAGWDTIYLGADVPEVSFLATVADHRPDLVCLSITMAAHLDEARTLIRLLKAETPGESARVLVGGAPFRLAADLWRSLGADGWAPDGASAVRIGAEVLGR